LAKKANRADRFRGASRQELANKDQHPANTYFNYVLTHTSSQELSKHYGTGQNRLSFLLIYWKHGRFEFTAKFIFKKLCGKVTKIALR
jgi:hypothetical protein